MSVHDEPRHRAGRPSLVAQARAFLAQRFGGDWDGPYLLCGTNQILLDFNPLADRPGVWLWLEGAHVAVPETRLGGEIIEALRDHADATRTPLLAGPAINHGYWASDDGLHPRRHPWLTAVGTKDGDLVYAYVPGT